MAVKALDGEAGGSQRAAQTTSILMGTLASPGWDAHVQTLLDQTIPADEFLVVVDRATAPDEREALAGKWPQIRFLFNEANIGLTRSLNRGLGAATGDIVFRADDDDEYFPTRIERQLETLRQTGADLVSSWSEGTSAPGAAPYTIRAPLDDAAIKAGLLKRNVMLHPGLAFRREAVLAIGGYNESFVYAQDYALYLAAIRAGLTFANVGEPLLRRSYHPGSISVGRRYRQLMFSCAARVMHCAHLGDRKLFVQTVAHYAVLAATPRWARSARRKVFGLLGKGV